MLFGKTVFVFLKSFFDCLLVILEELAVIGRAVDYLVEIVVLTAAGSRVTLWVAIAFSSAAVLFRNAPFFWNA